MTQHTPLNRAEPHVPPHHDAVEGAPAKDPVCDMTVKLTTSHRSLHDGNEVLFCSARCKEKFAANPALYLEPAPPALAPANIASRTPNDPRDVMGDVEYTCPMHPEIVRGAPGSCPICGMALESRVPALDGGPDPELRDMTRRFWSAAALTLPLLAIVMGEMGGGT